MGEKGISADALSAVGASEVGSSVVERTTTVVTSTLQDVGQSVLGTTRDKAVDAVTEQAVDEARERLRKDESNPTDDGGAAEPA